MTSQQEIPPPAVPDERQPKAEQRPPFLERREGRIVLFSAMGGFAVTVLIFGFFYLKFAAVINRRLEFGPFSGTVNIFSAPRTVAVNDPVSAEEVLVRLQRAGYTTARGN